MMRKYYLKILQILCKKELKAISDKKDKHTLKELIQWYDLMAIECINIETKNQERLLKIYVQTVNKLEKLL